MTPRSTVEESSREGVLHERYEAAKGTQERLEVFTLSLSSTVTKFKSPYDLTSEKECNTSLTSEVSEHTETELVSKVSTVPVACLSYSSTSSRSSRTALMLARGGKDPYASINQLPARAFNTHDFMTLYPCKIVLELKDDTLTSTAGTKDVGHEPGVESSSQETTTSVLISQELNDSSTSPVIVSMDVSTEDYVEQSRRDFGFNEMDFQLARIIHDTVAERKEFGMTVALLQVLLNHVTRYCY